MVMLRPMTVPEYNAFMAALRVSYGAERAQAEDFPLDLAQAEADAQIAQLLPQGIRTPYHYFWRIIAEDGEAVGSLWVNHKLSDHRAFIYDIEIDDAQRGKGYGEAAMRELETAMRFKHVTHIGLSVFGFNTTARALYDKLGYQVAATYMIKRLGEDA